MDNRTPVRHILHADLDAFYASVEQLDNPNYRGQPVLVGGSPQSRGVVAAASYEARRFGVHSALPMSTAVRRCPHAIIVRPRFDRYREISGRIMAIFRDLTALVEPLSLDEAYLDVTAVVAGGRQPLDIAQDLKRRVKRDAGLNISVGASTSKSVAKIASDLRKPDGLVVVSLGEEAAFLAPLPVGKLSGIGPKAVETLHRDGVETIGQLAEQSTEWFVRRFGKRADSVQAKAMGQDRESVQPRRETKSVSAETTFPNDLRAPEDLYPELARLCGRVARSLSGKGLRGKTVNVKLRLSDFTTFTRQVTLPEPTASEEEMLEVGWQLVARELSPGRAFRLIGVGMSSLRDPDGAGPSQSEPLDEDSAPIISQLALPLFGADPDERS
jgi:DNA polymerase-4